MRRARRSGVVLRHEATAPSAALTAASISCAFARGTFLVTWPVAGFVMSPRRVLLGAAGPPLIHIGTVASLVVSSTFPEARGDIAFLHPVGANLSRDDAG